MLVEVCWNGIATLLMATRLGDVWMQFRLDTSQAQKDLDKLAAQAKREGAKAGRGPTPATEPIPGIGKTRSETQREDYFRQLSSVVVNTAGRGLQGNTVAAGAAGVAGQTAKFLPPAAAGALMTAGKVALAYGVASETAKFLPEAFAYGKELAGTKRGEDQRIDDIEVGLDELRRIVTGFEAKITSSFGAIGDSMDYSKAVKRLTGQMPDTAYYREVFREARIARKEIKNWQDNVKAKEAPVNWAQTMMDMFLRNSTR